jgi:hypothetical protein
MIMIIIILLVVGSFSDVNHTKEVSLASELEVTCDFPCKW